jgi:polysaccharide biosynthesis/export protein
MTLPFIQKDRISDYHSGFVLIFVLATLSLQSCVSSRQVVYFQTDSTSLNRIRAAEVYVPRIRPGDVLAINVSSLSQEASTFFNPPARMRDLTYRVPATNNFLPEMDGYLVSPEGTIEFPMLGELAVGKLTVSECGKLIREKLKPFLKEPNVNVRNQNFRISVLGEVARPALFTVPNDQITLIEALSLAGDATIYGRRENVLIIREENGEKTFARVDLTRRDLFRSPYYYLRPNDVVYVEPGKARVANADRLYLIVPTVLSALSFIAIIVTRQ